MFSVRPRVVILTAGLLPSLLALGSAQAAGAEKVRIGLLLPLSGTAATEGRAMLRGATLAAEEINAKGGIRVGTRRLPIELVVEDDQTTPEGSVLAAQRLVAAKVHVLAGGLASGASLASQPLIARAKLPYIINGIGTPQATRRTDIDTRFFFHYNEIGPEEGRYLAKFLAEVLRPRLAPGRKLKVAVLYNDTPFGQDVVLAKPGPGLLGWAKSHKLPLDFVYVKGYPIGTTDFHAQLAEVKAAEPDVVVPVGYESETVAMLQQGIHDLGIPALWGPAAKAVETPSYYTSLGPDAELTTILTYYTIYDTPKGRLGDLQRRFRAAYAARWQEPAALRSANQYDTIYIFRRAIENAHSLDRNAIRIALGRLNMKALTLPLVSDRIHFDPKYREIRFLMFVAQIYRDPQSQELRSRIVWPARVATGEFEGP